jgi:tetratricopeptide (TPR) repeat protein
MKRGVVRAVILGAMTLAAAGCAANGNGIYTGGYGTQGTSLSGNYLAARHAGRNQDAVSAAHYYSEALALDPGDSDILERAFLLELSSGDFNTAIDLADRIAVLRPSDRLARLVLGAAALRRGDYQKSRDQVRKAGPGPLTNIINSLIIAWSYAGSGMTDIAVEHLDELNRVGGLELYKAYHSALMYDLAGRSGEAEVQYDEAMRLSQSTSIRVIEAYGRFLERDGRHSQALAVYQSFSEGVGNHPLIAAAAFRANHPQKRPVPRLVENAHSGAAEAVFALAGALAREAKRGQDLPIVYLRLALFLRRDFPIAQSLLANLLERNNRIEAATNVYAGVRRSSPLWANSRIRIAQGLNRLKRKEDAISVLEDVIDVAPDNLDVLTSIADLHHSNEDFGQSSKYYARAVAQLDEPKKQHWPLYYQYGVSLERSKRWDLAEVYLKKALELEPNQAFVLNYLGYSWIDQGKHLDKAMDLIEKAVSLAPQNGYIVDSLGWGHYQLGRFPDAVIHLERAVLLEPGDPVINDHLGDAFWMVGRKLEARFQWSHALALDPDDDVKARASRKLAVGLDVVLADEKASGKIKPVAVNSVAKPK